MRLSERNDGGRRGASADEAKGMEEVDMKREEDLVRERVIESSVISMGSVDALRRMKDSTAERGVWADEREKLLPLGSFH
jgi:hypothetical protein